MLLPRYLVLECFILVLLSIPICLLVLTKYSFFFSPTSCFTCSKVPFMKHTFFLYQFVTVSMLEFSVHFEQIICSAYFQEPTSVAVFNPIFSEWSYYVSVIIPDVTLKVTNYGNIFFFSCIV